MDWSRDRQAKGDVIVCDDYTTYHSGRQQYPGIIRAVDEFVEENNYKHNIYYGDDGDKERGYVHLVKNNYIKDYRSKCRTTLGNSNKSIGAAFGSAPKGAPPPWGMLLNQLNNSKCIKHASILNMNVC